MRLQVRIVLWLIAALAVSPLYWVDLGAVQAWDGGGPHYTAWSTPVPVPELNTGQLEYPYGISRDGLSLYFIRWNFSFTEVSIYVAHRPDAEAAWSEPVLLPDTINTGLSDEPFVSADGHWLYFVSDRPGGVGGYDLYASWRTHVHDDGGWQPAMNLSALNTPGYERGPALFTDDETGTTFLYFGSDPTGIGFETHIYVSVLGPGGFGPPTPVTELNGPGFENRPYLRRDGREIFFLSFRNGTVSVYTSTRSATDQPWSPPVVALDYTALGDSSETFVTTPVLSWDAQTLYVGVYRPSDGGNGDIYVSHREKVRGPKN